MNESKDNLTHWKKGGNKNIEGIILALFACNNDDNNIILCVKVIAFIAGRVPMSMPMQLNQVIK